MTTAEVFLPASVNKTSVEQLKDRYCCNCGRTGHRYNDCTAKMLDEFTYDECKDQAKSDGKIKENQASVEDNTDISFIDRMCGLALDCGPGAERGLTMLGTNTDIKEMEDQYYAEMDLIYKRADSKGVSPPELRRRKVLSHKSFSSNKVKEEQHDSRSMQAWKASESKPRFPGEVDFARRRAPQRVDPVATCKKTTQMEVQSKPSSLLERGRSYKMEEDSPTMSAGTSGEMTKGRVVQERAKLAIKRLLGKQCCSVQEDSSKRPFGCFVLESDLISTVDNWHDNTRESQNASVQDGMEYRPGDLLPGSSRRPILTGRDSCEDRKVPSANQRSRLSAHCQKVQKAFILDLEKRGILVRGIVENPDLLSVDERELWRDILRTREEEEKEERRQWDERRRKKLKKSREFYEAVILEPRMSKTQKRKADRRKTGDKEQRKRWKGDRSKSNVPCSGLWHSSAPRRSPDEDGSISLSSYQRESVFISPSGRNVCHCSERESKEYSKSTSHGPNWEARSSSQLHKKTTRRRNRKRYEPSRCRSRDRDWNVGSPLPYDRDRVSGKKNMKEHLRSRGWEQEWQTGSSSPRYRERTPCRKRKRNKISRGREWQRDQETGSSSPHHKERISGTPKRNRKEHSRGRAWNRDWQTGSSSPFHRERTPSRQRKRNKHHRERISGSPKRNRKERSRNRAWERDWRTRSSSPYQKESISSSGQNRKERSTSRGRDRNWLFRSSSPYRKERISSSPEWNRKERSRSRGRDRNEYTRSSSPYQKERVSSSGWNRKERSRSRGRDRNWLFRSSSPYHKERISSSPEWNRKERSRSRGRDRNWYTRSSSPYQKESISSPGWNRKERSRSRGRDRDWYTRSSPPYQKKRISSSPVWNRKERSSSHRRESLPSSSDRKEALHRKESKQNEHSKSRGKVGSCQDRSSSLRCEERICCSSGGGVVIHQTERKLYQHEDNCSVS